jgi:beta-galactosidase
VYGGLYRYVNLKYVPAVSFDKVFLTANADEDGKKGTLTVRTRLYNPLNAIKGKVMAKLFDPSGTFIEEQLLQVNGQQEITLLHSISTIHNCGQQRIHCFILL